MKFNLKHGQDDLQVGDPIIVAYGSGLTMGIFAGTGKDTIQYYMPTHIHNIKEISDEKGKKATFYKAYVYGESTRWRVMKINKDAMNEKELENYERAIEILKQENIVK